MFSLHARTFAIIASLAVPLAAPALAQTAGEICGPAPALPTQLETSESFKGQVQGQAKFLSGFVGKADLGGQVEAARRSLNQSSSDFMAAQKDAYFAYMFCVTIFQDKNLSTQDRIRAIQEFKKPLPVKSGMGPPPDYLFFNRNLVFERIQDVLGKPNTQVAGKDGAITYASFENDSMIYYSALKSGKLLGFAALFKEPPEILSTQMQSKGLSVDGVSLDSLKSRLGKKSSGVLSTPGKPMLLLVDGIDMFGSEGYTLAFWFGGSVTCGKFEPKAALNTLSCSGSVNGGRLVAIAASYDFEAILKDSILTYDTRNRDEAVGHANFRLLRKSEDESAYLSRHLAFTLQ